MNIAGWILKIAGWSVSITVPDYPKCIICVAPHTSNWDFILGKLAYASVGRKAGFLMKQAWFFFPFGCFFRAIGGIPVKHGNSLTETLINKFNDSSRLTIAITPEGTRSRNAKWHYGALRIATATNIPIALGGIDFATKHIVIEQTFIPTGDLDADMKAIKHYYKPFVGRHPEKFSTDDA